MGYLRPQREDTDTAAQERRESAWYMIGGALERVCTCSGNPKPSFPPPSNTGVTVKTIHLAVAFVTFCSYCELDVHGKSLRSQPDGKFCKAQS